jgi:hypothetical protein
MKASVEIKAEMLKAAWIEDRQEVRGIRTSVYNITTLLCGLSFAVTSFLFDKHFATNVVPVTVVADAMLIVLLWAFVMQLKRDLRCSRQCLTLRQDLIRSLNETNNDDLDPFPDASTVTPDIEDRELWRLPTFATVAIVMKLGMIVAIAFAEPIKV